MDIYECHDRYGISLKKLRLMQNEGVLKLEGDKTEKYWRQVINDIKKGQMSARSLALAYRFPGRLNKIAKLTKRDRHVIAAQFEAIDLPVEEIELDIPFSTPLGAAEKHPFLLNKFINTIQKIIPDYEVTYYYIAVRLLIFTCKTEFQINLMAEDLARAFASARDEEIMRGWWHTESRKYDQERTIYHQPRRYDL